MRLDTDFMVRYRVEEPVPIKDIIESLQGIDVVLRETALFLPRVLPGLQVEHTETKVRQIAQESPLRELFVLSMFLAFQRDLEAEVPPMIEHLIGHKIPHNMDTMVTLLALIIVFYGVGAIKDLVVGGADDGPSQRKLASLIAEVAQMSGTSEKMIRDKLDERYADKTAWKKLTNATARFFRVSKRQDSAALDVNDRAIERDIVSDIPADYLFDDVKSDEVSRTYYDVSLDLHAQDKDHKGQGWAAVIPGITDHRVRLKLMPDVEAGDLWGVDHVKGDVTVLFDRIGTGLVAKSIQLHKITPT